MLFKRLCDICFFKHSVTIRLMIMHCRSWRHCLNLLKSTFAFRPYKVTNNPSCWTAKPRECCTFIFPLISIACPGMRSSCDSKRVCHFYITLTYVIWYQICIYTCNKPLPYCHLELQWCQVSSSTSEQCFDCVSPALARQAFLDPDTHFPQCSPCLSCRVTLKED